MFAVGNRIKLRPYMGGDNLTEGKVYEVINTILSLNKVTITNDLAIKEMVPAWIFEISPIEINPIESTFDHTNYTTVDTKTGEVMKFKQVKDNMTQDEYLTMFQELQALQFSTTKKKNSDYTGGDTSDPFKNFRSSEAFGVSVEKGFMCRMSDKWMRLCGLISGHKPLVKESIEDTLLDMSTYCLLLICYLRGKK